MAPYNPPNTHYSQMDVSMYEEDDIFKFIGKNLDLSYMWYDKERKVIELWGPYESLQYFSAHQILECELDLSCNKILIE